MKNIFKNKNVLVVGLKKSGESSLNLLLKLGAFCYVHDKNKKLLQTFASSKYNLVSQIDEDMIKIMDYMIISPSVSIFDESVKLAKLYGVTVLSELELGTYFLKGNLIGITGTNGKTTTSSLLYHILKLAQKPAVLCGNIGEPITENILPFCANYVVEMSSFQLESAVKIKPKISAITNIAPNHLDRHITFENYRDAKYNIFKDMKKNGLLVLNYDDKTLKKLKDKKLKPRVVWISAKKEIDGFFAKNGKIYQKKHKKTKFLFDFSTKLLGEHNIYNILICVAICRKLKIKDEIIKMGIATFEPLCHRLQFVKNVNGVDYINDSKSTSPDSTITAINSISKRPIILLLGGSDKKTCFDRLAKKIKQSKDIKLVVVSGATSKKIISALKNYGVNNYICAESFFEALKIATKCSQFGDTILLSPACASFDYFSSFEQRGDYFCEYVNNLE